MIKGIELRDEMDRDGFIVIEDFFDEEYMSQLDLAIQRYIAHVVPSLPPHRVFYESRPPGSIKGMNKMDLYDPFWRDFKQHQKFTDLAMCVFNTNEISQDTLYFFDKPPICGSVVP